MGDLKERVERKIKKYKQKDGKRLIWQAVDWDNKEFNKFLAQLDEKPPQGEIINDGRNDLIKLNRFAKGSLMLKKFNLTRTYDQLRFCVLDSKAVRSLRIALALEEVGVKTPQPVAVVEKRGNYNQLLYSYYLTEYVDYDYNLLDIVADANHPRRKEVKELLPGIAQGVQKMHQGGIIHNDLHAGNILVKDIDNRPEFYYIDLNRGRIKQNPSTTKQIKDLARFKLTNKEQKIFMKNYAPDNYQNLLELMIQQREKRKKFLDIKRAIKSRIRFWR